MHIVIIEDELILSKNLAKELHRNGYTTSVLNSYNDFLKNTSKKADLYIIDISLTDGSGFDIIKYLKNTLESNSPIIIISGYSDIESKIYGLELGADDYLTKPFLVKELIARIRALFRRKLNIPNNYIIKYNNIVLNINKNNVQKNGKEIDLTRYEFQIIEYFLLNIGVRVKKEDLIKSVWGSDSFTTSSNTINATISKVRKKLGSEFKLKTLINEGYILEK